MDLSKVEMEARALTIIETFTIKGDCELPLPPNFFFNEWVVCLIIKNRHNYGQDSFARSQN